MIYLLDSNVCIDLMRGIPGVVSAFRQVSPDDCALSTIALFELRAGAEKSANPERERGRVDLLASTLNVIPWDAAAARQAAEIRFHLERRGEKIGAYDTLIAGHAIALGLTLVTDNTSEFARVEGLAVENWRD